MVQVQIGMSRTRATALGTMGPTTSAMRYDESGGVGAKVTRRPPRPSLSSRRATPFDSATASLGTPATATRQIALKAGSSKQGKTRRASAASNWVTASGPAR